MAAFPEGVPPFPSERKDMERNDTGRKKCWKWLIPAAGMLVGLLILVYPAAMDMYNSYLNEKAISSMSSVYDRYGANAEEIAGQLEEADRYNRMLAGEDISADSYERQLTFDGNGVMGYIEIPCIGVKMMLYHGTDDDILAAGAGHLEGTSLPVGGTSTHSVITAHSGMKNMRAFDNLRSMKEGDVFSVTVLGRKCSYRTESIETVLPYETDSLKIIQGEDRMTLVTCTPYGINDHRLLVHGVRTEEVTDTGEDEGTAEEIPAEEEPHMKPFMDIRIIPAAAAAVIIAGTVTAVIIRKRKEKRKCR